jgi:hypothetical protein
MREGKLPTPRFAQWTTSSGGPVFAQWNAVLKRGEVPGTNY